MLLRNLTNLKEFNYEGTDLENDSNLTIWELLKEKEKLNWEKEFIRLQRQDSLLGHITEIVTDNSQKEIIIEEDITKLNDLIGLQQMFLNVRKQNITNLRKICDTIENHNNKNSRIDEIGKTIAVIGKIVENWSPLKLIEPTDNLIEVWSLHSKNRMTLESSKLFKLLTTEEESNIELWEQILKKLKKKRFRRECFI